MLKWECLHSRFGYVYSVYRFDKFLYKGRGSVLPAVFLCKNIVKGLSLCIQKGILIMEKSNSTWKYKITGFLCAQTMSLMGSAIVQYAIVWYITLSTSSGKMLTISTLCGFVPQILISLFAGVWADRYDKKKLIMLSDAMIAVTTLILALLFMSGSKNIWFLFIALIVRSVGSGIQMPAVNAMIPRIVPGERLMRINGINGTLNSMILFLSPAVSAAVLSMASLEAALFIDVVTAVIGITITASLQLPSGASREKREISGTQQLREGFSYLRSSIPVRRLLVFHLFVLFFVSPFAFLTPLLVSRTFGPEVYRLMASEMTYSIGSVLGGILIASWGGLKNRLHTVLLATAVYGLLMLTMGGVPVFFIYLVVNLLSGVTAPCYNSPVTVYLQENVEPELHGRVFGFVQVIASCAFPLGMMIFGPAADMVRIQYILIGNGAVLILLALYGRFKLFHVT